MVRVMVRVALVVVVVVVVVVILMMMMMITSGPWTCTSTETCMGTVP